MYHQCETCRRVFTDAEARHPNPDPASERADIVFGREKNREYVAEQRRGTLPARQRSDEIVGATESGQLLGHVLNGRR
jgi:hypothetical protein